MARDKLQVLLAVRLFSVEQARSALGACLAAEAVVADRLRALDAAAQRNRETCAGWDDAHKFLEMSAIRLASLRAERRTVVAELATAAARSADARGIVTVARTAAEVVEQVTAERKAAGQAGEARREQHVLDDIARARRVGRPDAGGG
jgi:hypothetical protein